MVSSSHGTCVGNCGWNWQSWGMKSIPNFSNDRQCWTLPTNGWRWQQNSRHVMLQVRKKSQNGSGSHEQPKIAWGRRIHEVSHLGLCENGDLPPIYGHLSRKVMIHQQIWGLLPPNFSDNPTSTKKGPGTSEKLINRNLSYTKWWFLPWIFPLCCR